ncbi:unnamed protein product [Ranitomeya imitator]|uniref:Uncharacterized protein n=1 Tax=Ranitomeya imitator TaxID=111125 RepID=A0ABN9LF49_9NEOB|nr:unnamed protein product [Ranitomeya imitator]
MITACKWRFFFERHSKCAPNAASAELSRPLLMHPMILFALAAAAWHWLLQREGRVRDAVTGKRPRLAALHTAADIRRWIPSIKSDMEYYLEQSQLIHYSDRKIAEFQEKLEVLKKEYQSHLWKLRRLDPSCKEHPWKLRGYTRKRTVDGKVPSWVKSGAGERPGDALLSTVLCDNINEELSNPEEEDDGSSTKECKAAVLDLTNINPQGQDKPLQFSNANSHPQRRLAEVVL